MVASMTTKTTTNVRITSFVGVITFAVVTSLRYLASLLPGLPFHEFYMGMEQSIS